MLSRDQILKIDILTPDHTRILSASYKQFSLQSTDGTENSSDTMLIIKGKGLPEIEHYASVSVVASMRNGKRIKFPSYVSVSTDLQLNIVIKSGQSKPLEERRRYYKIDVNIPCVINCVERNGKRSVLDKPYITQISDLNIGGIFLCICSEPLEKDDKLMLTIDLGENVIDLDATILRVQKNAAGDITGYGCQFVDISAAEEDIISQFVFQLQRDRLLKENQSEE